MELSNDAVNMTEWVLSIAVVVLPTLIVLAVSAWASREVIDQLRKLWLSVRGGVVAAVDEGTDPAVVLLASLVKRDPVTLAKTTKRAAEFLVSVLDEVVIKLEAPPQEHARPGLGQEATK